MATFPKSARLRRTPEFRSTFDQGKKVVCGPLVLYAAIREKTEIEPRGNLLSPVGFRLGLVVSRKVGNSVTRNRVKRSIREAFRNLRISIEKQEPWDRIDLIVLARPSAGSTPNQDLQDCFQSCLRRLQKTLSQDAALKKASKGDARDA